MAKSGYIGINGVARKIQKGYIGISGVARKIKCGYVGVNDKARKFEFNTPCTVTMSGSGWSTSGNMYYTHLIHNGTNYTSGTIEANVGDIVTVNFYGLAGQELSVQINGTWVYGSGNWEGVTGSATYEVVLTGDATFKIEVNGSYASSYTNITITMDE